MFASIWNDIKQQFNYGNMITRIIIVNVAIFMVVKLLWAILGGTDAPDSTYTHILHFFCMSSDPFYVLTHPWIIISSMFLHESFLHIFFNMLYLYWFGRIFGDLLGDQRVLPLYLLGGIAGGLAFFISANLLPYGLTSSGFALGASGAIMAIVVAAGVIAPDYIIRLLFLGDVKLKFIVGALIFIDLIMVAGHNNVGGHFAHLGGMAFGWFFIYRLRQGSDMAVPVNNFMDWVRNLFNTQKGPRVAYRNPNLKKKQRQRKNAGAHGVSDNDDYSSHQDQLDAILDKIKVKGYDSLSATEKEFLFNASKK